MRILITGSRNWTDWVSVDEAILEAVRNAAPNFDIPVTIVHGGCSGADDIAGQVAEFYAFEQEVHPADWNTHGKAAGPIRNQEMVDLGADICLAFPLGESRGTRDCMRRARKAGIRVRDFG